MRFYCPKCGVELIHSRKAVPDRGHIFDFINPHECEGYAIKANEGEEPTVLDIIDSLRPIGSVQEVSNGKNEAGRYTEPGDRRSNDSKITSTAPSGVLRAMRDLPSDGEDL